MLGTWARLGLGLPRARARAMARVEGRGAFGEGLIWARVRQSLVRAKRKVQFRLMVGINCIHPKRGQVSSMGRLQGVQPLLAVQLLLAVHLLRNPPRWTRAAAMSILTPMMILQQTWACRLRALPVVASHKSRAARSAVR